MDDEIADVERQRERIMEGFRAYGRTFGELGRAFASGLGLHSTDAFALIEIIAAEERGEPLSQSQLSRRVGLTTGATSNLLNRLENHGHIARSRVHDDRRVVTLHSTPDIHRTVDDFFDPLGARLDAMASTYPPEVLDQIERFVGDLRLTMDAYLDEVPAPGPRATAADPRS